MPDELERSIERIEKHVQEMRSEHKQVQERMVRVEVDLNTANSSLTRFFDGEFQQVVKTLDSMNDKLQKQLEKQAKQDGEVELLKQRMDLEGKLLNEKLANLEAKLASGQSSTLMNLGTGAGSAGIVVALIQVIQYLMEKSS